MNASRRKEIRAIIDRVEALGGELESLRSDLEEIRDAEQDYYDNMPESLQGSDRGYAAEEAVTQLGDALNELDSFDHSIAVTSLEEAAL